MIGAIGSGVSIRAALLASAALLGAALPLLARALTATPHRPAPEPLLAETEMRRQG
jgi:hypothetical protein